MNCIQVQLSMVPTKEETNPLPSQPCPTRVSLVRPRFGGLPPRGGLGGWGWFRFFRFVVFLPFCSRPPFRPPGLYHQGKLTRSNGESVQLRQGVGF